MSYRDLEVFHLSEKLVGEIHRMSIEKLPSFEKFETGAQIRRSIKSVKANIVEGYCRRRYKKDFLHFLVIAHGSAQETLDHLETLKLSGSLIDQETYDMLSNNLKRLARQLYCFIESVNKNHR
jgi:four helix bundle protein